MPTINATYARNNLYKLIDDVNENSSPVTIVNNRRGKNAVLISEDDWDSIHETLYLYSIPGLVDSILKAKKEPRSKMIEYKEDEFWDNV